MPRFIFQAERHQAFEDSRNAHVVMGIPGEPVMLAFIPVRRLDNPAFRHLHPVERETSAEADPQLISQRRVTTKLLHIL